MRFVVSFFTHFERFSQHLVPPVPLHPVVPVYPRNFSDPAEVAAERAALEADARNLHVHQRYLKQEAERVRARRLEVTSQMGKVNSM